MPYQNNETGNNPKNNCILSWKMYSTLNWFPKYVCQENIYGGDMKKNIFMVLALAVTLVGCSGKNETKDQASVDDKEVASGNLVEEKSDAKSKEDEKKASEKETEEEEKKEGEEPSQDQELAEKDKAEEANPNVYVDQDGVSHDLLTEDDLYRSVGFPDNNGEPMVSGESSQGTFYDMDVDGDIFILNGGLTKNSAGYYDDPLPNSVYYFRMSPDVKFGSYNAEGFGECTWEEFYQGYLQGNRVVPSIHIKVENSLVGEISFSS